MPGRLLNGVTNFHSMFAKGLTAILQIEIWELKIMNIFRQK